MRKLPAITLSAIAASALAGTAIAASPKSHVMDVPLPDGSVAHVEYVGNIAPRVTVAPAPFLGDFWSVRALPPFGDFQRIFDQLDRQMEQMARQPVVGTQRMNVASYDNLPGGATSTTVVSVSNGGATCTRTTEVVSQGPDKPSKVTSNVSGQCGTAAAPGQPVPPPAPRSVHHT